MNARFAALTRPFLQAALAAAPLLLAGGSPVLAVGQGPYSLEVLVDGRPLHELWGNGRTYVETRTGREYSLRLTNNTGARVAIALSVDGLNSIDAKTTTAYDGSKWILGPYESITLDGWQTSSATARRFFFTTEEASYGAWLGKTSNLGVISAAVFRERVRPQAWLYRQKLEGAPSSEPAPGSADSAVGGLGGVPEGQRGEMNESRESVPAPPAAAAPQGRDREAGAGVESKSRGDAAPRPMPAPKDEYAATGIGRELEHRVDRVQFDAEPKPAAALEIRYEYRNALVKLGLLPPRSIDPLDRRERARGFTDSGFSPDPYRGN